MYNEGIRAFTANGALTAHARVKASGGSVTSPVQVELAGSGEQHIGITEYAAGNGTIVAVKLRTFPGTVEAIAAGIVVQGAVIYGAADGKVDDASAGSAIGIALEAAGADGDIIEIVDFSVLSTTAATVSIADALAHTDAATVEAALEEIYIHLHSAQVTIPIPLGSITMEDGTVLTKQATTVAGIAQIGNAEQVIDIPVDCSSGENLGFSVPVPQDLDDSANIEVHVLVGKAANLDSLTLDCEVYPCAAGDVANADIQDTAAQAITEAASELTFVCGADGVLAAPGALTVVLAVGGTNDGDAVYIYGVWIEYTRQILTS
ncbi:MAG TPA: hypothetical protein VMV77_14215 [Bacteroidales bacterium]|nr:hypothetical protein [Bacteroidales bacterium]